MSLPAIDVYIANYLFSTKDNIDFSRRLPLFLTISLVLALFRPLPLQPSPPLITNEHTSYYCSKEVTNNISKQNAPIEIVLSGDLFWVTKLSIIRMLSTQPGKETEQSLAFLNSRDNQCNKTVLFLPSPPVDLTFPTVEILPNRQVCVNRRLLKNKCMPNKPVAFQVAMRSSNAGSLIVSASYSSATSSSKSKN